MQRFRSFVKTDEIQGAGAASWQSMAQADVLLPGDVQTPRLHDTPAETGPSAISAPTGLLPGSKIDSGSVPGPQQSSQHTRRQLTIIHAEVKRKKAAASPHTPGRHLSPRLRQTLPLLTTLLVLSITLATVVPLATGQSPFTLPAGLSTLLHSLQADWQNLTLQGSSQGSAASKRPPPMQIPRSQLVAVAQQDAVAAGIDPTYFVRQINLESGFNPNAVSPGGAEGVAQFEPSTAAGLGINPFDPIQALQAAAQMMARYYHQYGDYAKALAAYNAGPASLQNAENSCGANWLSCMPAQTQNYVHTIMG
jgi:hypothetical protein